MIATGVIKGELSGNKMFRIEFVFVRKNSAKNILMINGRKAK